MAREDTADASSWRLLVKVALKDIIIPGNVEWMDDDNFTDEGYAQRSLDDIERRFTMYAPTFRIVRP
jgi:hypothetical protein